MTTYSISLRMSSSTQLQCRDKTIAVLTADLRECEDRLRDAKLSSDEFQRRVIVTKLEVGMDYRRIELFAILPLVRFVI